MNSPILTGKLEVSALTITGFADSPTPREIIRIDKDGRIFWNGREVETDDDFRAVMMELAKRLCR